MSTELAAYWKDVPEIEAKQQSRGDAVLNSALNDEKMDEPFPIDCLPSTMKAIVKAIAETERTPQSLAGCCVLGIVSASMGAGLQVKSGPDRTTPGNLYIVPSAESGSGKSESFRHAARPFQKFEAELLERWKSEELPGLQAEKDILESEIQSLKRNAGRKSAEREEIRTQLEEKKLQLAKVEADLVAPVLSCEDITTERLATLMQKRGECLASLSPDAGTIINNLLGRYNKLNRTDESVYLKAFSRDYCRIDRQTREPVVLREPCLSALWLVQPDKIDTLLGERSLTDGGLIPRLLVCHTNCQPKHIVNGHEGISHQVQQDYEELIQSLLKSYRMTSEAYTIEISASAKECLDQHYNRIVGRRLNDLRDVTSFAARWNEQAWRIAVVLHAGLHGDSAHDTQMASSTAQAAIGLADWFSDQQLKILAGGRIKVQRAKLDEVLSLVAAQPSGITARDLQRASIARDAQQAHELLERFESQGILQSEVRNTGGRPSMLFKRKVVE